MAFLIAFIIFFSTTFFSVSYFALFALPLVMIRSKFKFTFDQTTAVILIIVILSILNELFALLGGHLPQSLIYLFPYSILILFTVYIGKSIDESVVRWLLIFSLLDIIVGIFEFLTGTRSFFDPTALAFNEQSKAIYDLSVYGIHENKSGFAYAVFAAAILAFRFNNAIPINKNAFKVLIALGFIISFNRSVLIAVCFGIIIYLADDLIRNQFRIKYLTALIVVLVFAVSLYYIEELMFQFMRGNTEFTPNVLSERDYIYPRFWKFILENPLLGNGSFKYLITMPDGRVLHAHNAYLQTLATNGVVISILYFSIIFINLNWKNYIPVLAIMMLSMFQCTIFWGISYIDIVFYSLLLSTKSFNLSTAKPPTTPLN